MLHQLLNPILLDAATPVRPRPFDINPALSPWILFIGAVVAAASVVYLYTAQQKIAQRGIVNWLTTIRVLLILLVIALLLGPVRQWAHTHHSSGTLWVLVDNSMSMRQKDPQSTDAERLRWADSLGYLPPDLRPSRVGANANRLAALRDDLEHYRSDADHLVGDQNDTKQREALATHLVQWKSKLTSVADELGNDPQVKQLAADVPGTLHQSADTIGKSITLIQSGEIHQGPWVWPIVAGAILALAGAIFFWFDRKRFKSPALAHAAPSICMALILVAVGLGGWAAYLWPTTEDLAAENARPDQLQIVGDKATIPWQALHDNLSKSVTQIQPIATRAENEFLDAHRSDPRVQDAFNKVKQLDRADLAYAALTGNSTRSLKTLAEMMGKEDVKVVPFGDHTGISTPEKRELNQALKNVLKDPKGQNTDIAGALKFVTDQVGEDSTVLVVSDGRQNVGTEPDGPAQFLASRGTRVFTLAIGSHQTARDASVDHIDAPDWVYAEDQVVVSPVITLDGLKDRSVTVELRRDGSAVDKRTIKVKTDQEKPRLRFTDKPPKEGLYDYSVVIQPIPDEAVADNNSQSVRVAVKKDRLNVLLIDDEPGWEYQFLRNYLIRDHRVKLQVVLVRPAHIEEVQSPDAVKASPSREEGQIDAQVLPATRAEWSGFDIVILGDVPPEKLPVEQQKNLANALKDGGVKALLLIAGQRNMPMRYAGTPLAEVMPVELSGSKWTPQELQDQLRHGYVPAQAPDGLNSILGQFSEDVGTNAELWASMPLWFWHSEQTAARPGASVIWTIEDALTAKAKNDSAAARSAQSSADEYERTRQHALLATMNVGLGRVMYLAAGQTWRLRYVQVAGNDSHIEDLHRRFWGQVVRWAAGNDLPAGGKFVKFGANKHSYIGGEPVVITARVLKEDFTPMDGQSFKIFANRKSGGQVGEATMIEAPAEGAGIYRGTMTLPAGDYSLSVHGGDPERLLATDNSVDAGQKTLQIDVQPDATVEDRDVNADPEKMATIAKAGSGIALDGPYFDVLASHLPVIDHTETQISQAGLFSSPNDVRTQYAHWAFFAIFILLISAEWILRKRGGLV
ncbi:MAG TPA: hypothetical protein VLJ39_15860 [Tepidisphaeraceae bacterium]|nr:hypothetical protein [Tepidisphaeraceae bacterium]